MLLVAVMLISACASHEYVGVTDEVDPSTTATIVKPSEDSFFSGAPGVRYHITSFTHVDNYSTGVQFYGHETDVVVAAGERTVSVVYRTNAIVNQWKAQALVTFQARAGHVYRVVADEHMEEKTVDFWIEDTETRERASDIVQAPLFKVQLWYP